MSVLEEGLGRIQFLFFRGWLLKRERVLGNDPLLAALWSSGLASCPFSIRVRHQLGGWRGRELSLRRFKEAKERGDVGRWPGLRGDRLSEGPHSE